MKKIFLLLMIIISCSMEKETDKFLNVNKRFDLNNKIVNSPQINKDNFSFLVIADTHYSEYDLDYYQQLQLQNNFNADFIFNDGDICQSGTQENYQNVFNDKKNCLIPNYFVIGNHDLRNEGFELFQQYLNSSMYSFNINNFKFLILDTASWELGKKQKSWLETELNNNYKHIIITHYNRLLFDDSSLKNELKKLCDKYKVELVIYGHRHWLIDEKINDTRYITIGAMWKHTENVLKVSIINNIISYEIINF